MKIRVKWIKQNWNLKYNEICITTLIIEKKKKEEYDRIQKKKDDLWNMYFGFDGTCLSHDILKCRECMVSATGRCYSSYEE